MRKLASVCLACGMASCFVGAFAQNVGVTILTTYNANDFGVSWKRIVLSDAHL